MYVLSELSSLYLNQKTFLRFVKMLRKKIFVFKRKQIALHIERIEIKFFFQKMNFKIKIIIIERTRYN